MPLRLEQVIEVAVNRCRSSIRREKLGSKALCYLMLEVVPWSNHYWRVCKFLYMS